MSVENTHLRKHSIIVVKVHGGLRYTTSSLQ